MRSTFTDPQADSPHFTLNPLFDTDSYKSSHASLYRPGTRSMFSYIEARKGGLYPEVVFAGLQYIVKRYLVDARVTLGDVIEMKDLMAEHGEPFDYEGWCRIATVHNGRLPVCIRALPEGTVAPEGVALVTLESTDPEVFWAASWVETMLLRVWYPTNVATLSHHIKRTIYEALQRTSDDPAGQIPFKLHDFGSRGVSSQEGAALGGLGHLISFMGTDNIAALMLARRYYGARCAGFSIPATEHSTITSWGEDREFEAYANVLRAHGKPGGLVACVSDSYDLQRAITEGWCGALKQQVIDSGATLVVRPDSGDPASVVVDSLQRLDAGFGHTVNSKGYKVLNHVRVIQGDGINHESIKHIIRTFTGARYSADNVAFGMGGALLQQHNRDTQRFAMKCSSITDDNDVEHDVSKCPKTDPTKRSKAGRLDTIWDGGKLRTVRLLRGEKQAAETAMQLVYENGEQYNVETLDTIRQRCTI